MWTFFFPIYHWFYKKQKLCLLVYAVWFAIYGVEISTTSIKHLQEFFFIKPEKIIRRKREPVINMLI